MRKRKVLFFNCSLIFIIFFLFPVNIFSENNISLRFAPAFIAPIGFPQFSFGIGADVSLDWSFWSAGKDLNFGVSAAGNITSITVNAGNPLILFEGKTGIFLRWHPFDQFSFRGGFNAGIYQFARGDVAFVKFLSSVSASVNYHLLPFLSLYADASYTYRVFTENLPLTSFNASVGVVFNLSEIMNSSARVKVERTQQYRIFPVSWAWYENNPIAEVRITNEEPNTITDVSVSFFLDSYMGQPWRFAQIPRLASGTSIDVPITALFNDVMLGLTENVNANGVIQIQYSSLGSQKEAVFPIQMPIFHRNTLSWDDDRRAAAFVSPRDSSARIFARYVQNVVDLHMRSQQRLGLNASGFENIPENVHYAIALFEALRLYGISYVVVPSLSFVNMQADESALDNVTYPYETLYYRGGDCTYLSILYCSLLEALNIETAFITIPGHLYMAFEVGDSDWMKGNIDIIELNGKRWLPVEITVPEEGFFRAWRIGARQWRTSGIEADIFPIRECWEVYPPVTISASVDYPPDMPQDTDIIQAFLKELAEFK